MRTILISDLIAMARVAMLLRSGTAAAEIATLVDQTHAAHKMMKRLGRPHPAWGNGSLVGRAAGLAKLREPCASDPVFLRALQAVIAAVLTRADQRHGPR